MSSPFRWITALLGSAALAGAIVSCSEGGGGPSEPGPTGAIRATVQADGSALANVTVRLFRDGGTSAIGSANTSTAGQVLFDDLDAGAYDVEVVVLAGYELAAGESARRDVSVVADETATVGFALEEIVVAPTVGQIRARVVEDGTGVSDVEVTLFEAGGTMALATLTTGADGRALFGSLEPGDFDVEITLPADHEMAAGDAARKEVAVAAGVTADVQFAIDGPEPTTVDIQVAGFAFTPSDITIAPGTTVRWIWGSGDHTVTPDGHTEWTSTALNSSGDMLVHTFDEVGEYPYFCIPHQSAGMTGIVRVE